MCVKLLTDHHLEILSRKGDHTGSSESKLVKMPHCWKSHAVALILEMVIKEAIICDGRLKTFENIPCKITQSIVTVNHERIHKG